VSKPVVHFAGEQERHLWRQSEVMLRMAQSREPNRPGRNNNGLIVAALPDGVYFTPWVRDMACALDAFIHMGHQAEARAGLLAYSNAQPTGKMRAQTAGVDYQISVVRYFGDGSEEPFFTEEGATNIEFDDWGWLCGCWANTCANLTTPTCSTPPRIAGCFNPSARDLVVKPLLANLESYGGGEIVAADTSIWEEHKRTRSISPGQRPWPSWPQELCRGCTACRRTNPHGPMLWLTLLKLRKGFAAAFIRDGKMHGTLEPGMKNDIDGALLALSTSTWSPIRPSSGYGCERLSC